MLPNLVSLSLPLSWFGGKDEGWVTCELFYCTVVVSTKISPTCTLHPPSSIPHQPHHCVPFSPFVASLTLFTPTPASQFLGNRKDQTCPWMVVFNPQNSWAYIKTAFGPHCWPLFWPSQILNFRGWHSVTQCSRKRKQASLNCKNKNFTCFWWAQHFSKRKWNFQYIKLFWGEGVVI